MDRELWNSEQIRDYLGVSTLNSVWPWLSRHRVRPAHLAVSERGGVRYYYDAEVIRTVAASLPGSPGRPHRPASDSGSA